MHFIFLITLVMWLDKFPSHEYCVCVHRCLPGTSCWSKNSADNVQAGELRRAGSSQWYHQLWQRVCRVSCWRRNVRQQSSLCTWIIATVMLILQSGDIQSDHLLVPGKGGKVGKFRVGYWGKVQERCNSWNISVWFSTLTRRWNWIVGSLCFKQLWETKFLSRLLFVIPIFW